jgi:hypothetical protein
VALREQWVVLPGLGAAHLPDAPAWEVAELPARSRPWPAEVVPGRIADAAAQAIADHRAAWRIRHLCPDPGTVDAPARAWTADDHAGPTSAERAAPTLAADPTAWRLDARAVLCRRRLAEPEGFARLCALDAYGTTDPAEAPAATTAADRLLVAGETRRARAAYLRDLDTDPFDPHAWIGLGLVAPRGSAERRALLERPELVLALQRALVHGTGRPAPPRRLAGWTGEVSQGWTRTWTAAHPER